MASTTDDIKLTIKGRVAIITLNRPTKLNSLSVGNYYTLGEKMREVAERDDIYITVVTGTGRFFSAGADIQQIIPKEAPVNPREHFVRNFVANNLDVAHAFYTHPKILVIALNGPTIGFSAALCALGDFVYATPHAFLLTPFTSIGLVAEGVASRGLVTRLGVSKAKEALIMSKRISIDDLVKTGFVNKVFTPPSGKADDSDGFLELVLKEVEETLGTHLNQDSLVKMKGLIQQPEREVLDRQNVSEVFMGLSRFVAGIPQEEFRKIASGEKKHKL